MKTLLTLSFGLLILVAMFLGTGCQDDLDIVTADTDPVVAPLDTTSHDFVWEFDTIAVQYSMINSVAALSPDDIWVTGKFFQHDSLGRPDAKPIGNVAHWNGKEWTYHGFNSSGYESWYEMDDAFATSADNLWVCGGSPFQWDGAKWTTHGYDGFYFGSGIIETWASKNADYVCVVGLDRSCAYYRKDDPQFRKVVIPYQEDCLDVTGTEDGTMYVAAGMNDPYNGHIYIVTPERQATVYLDCPGMDPYALWFMNGHLHFSSGRNIYRIDSENGNEAIKILEVCDHIREEDHEQENNIVVMLQSNINLHYNGSTWKEFRIPYSASLRMQDVDVIGKDVYFATLSPDQYCVLVHGRLR